MQEVPKENLVPGKEYYLQCCFAPSSKPYKMIGTFEQLRQSPYIPAKRERTCSANFTNFRMLKHRSDPTRGYRIELALCWKFYEINCPTIQKNMENRAYNQVLLDIIKDEYFKPVELI
jgi:hypothetical protein